MDKEEISLVDRIWTVKHLQKYLMVCEKTARSEVRQAEKQKYFIVRRIGEGRGQFRMARDSVLDYYEGDRGVK